MLQGSLYSAAAFTLFGVFFYILFTYGNIQAYDFQGILLGEHILIRYSDSTLNLKASGHNVENTLRGNFFSIQKLLCISLVSTSR